MPCIERCCCSSRRTVFFSPSAMLCLSCETLSYTALCLVASCHNRHRSVSGFPNKVLAFSRLLRLSLPKHVNWFPATTRKFDVVWPSSSCKTHFSFKNKTICVDLTEILQNPLKIVHTVPWLKLGCPVLPRIAFPVGLFTMPLNESHITNTVACICDVQGSFITLMSATEYGGGSIFLYHNAMTFRKGNHEDFGRIVVDINYLKHVNWNVLCYPSIFYATGTMIFSRPTIEKLPAQHTLSKRERANWNSETIRFNMNQPE